jgi:hypothetical protein
VAPGGSRNLPNDIAFAATPGRVADTVFSRSRGPQAEAVVMFAREDHRFHTTCGECAHDRAGIECGRIEQVRIFVTVTPLLVCKGIDREVEKRVELELMPLQLARRRHGSFSGEGLWQPASQSRECTA